MLRRPPISQCASSPWRPSKQCIEAGSKTCIHVECFVYLSSDRHMFTIWLHTVYVCRISHVPVTVVYPDALLHQKPWQQQLIDYGSQAVHDCYFDISDRESWFVRGQSRMIRIPHMCKVESSALPANPPPFFAYSWPKQSTIRVQITWILYDTGQMWNEIDTMSSLALELLIESNVHHFTLVHHLFGLISRVQEISKVNISVNTQHCFKTKMTWW